MNTLAEFEARRHEIEPAIAQALSIGDAALRAYAGVGLYHNTLPSLVPSITGEGLVADSSAGSPDNEDVNFATELFLRAGYRYPANRRQFDIYIRGVRDGREPGVFFYPLEEPVSEFRTTYGIPERLHILAYEMGCVAVQNDGPYTEAERDRARTIFEKYKAIIHSDINSHVAVLRVNPFNPNVINSRLRELPEAVNSLNPESAVRQILLSEFQLWEGIYVPGSIAPADITVIDAHLPLLSSLRQPIDPSRSRFFYTPPHLQRTN